VVLGSSLSDLIAGCNKERVDECVETMEAHLSGIKLVIDLLFSRYVGYVDRLVKKYFNIRTRVPLVYIAAALHDLGKSLPSYQVRLWSTCSAPYHELVSASLILNHVDLGEAVISGDVAKVRALVAMAVLLHHHAMRPPSTYVTKDFATYALGDPRSSDKIYESISRYLRIVSKIYPNLRVAVNTELSYNSLLAGTRKLVSSLKIFDYALDRGRAAQAIARDYKVVVIMLYPLTIADSLAAAIQRSCRVLKPRLIESVCEEIESCRVFIRDVIKWWSVGRVFRNGFEVGRCGDADSDSGV